MENFNSLKDMWQQSTNAGGDTSLQVASIAKHAAGVKIKLMRQQLWGAVVLVGTAIFIASLVVFKLFVLQHWYTYAALALVCIICLVQAAILFATYKKIEAIDETALPAQHLQQWQSYYALRKQQAKWNMPLYYLFLNTAMGVYFIEMFSGRPVLNVAIFLAIYTGWMLFAWFYLGRRALKKEHDRLHGIMSDITGITQQLDDAR